MKVFAEETSEDPDVFNIQLTTWEIAVDRWRQLEERYGDAPCDFNDFFEEACVILVLAGTSVSQLLGQKTASTSPCVPGVGRLLDELVPEPTLRSKLKEFNGTYEDLRHFGEPKHESVVSIDETHFTEWMQALQKLWIQLGRPSKETTNRLFRNAFTVETIHEDS